ncbi:hypothetical protein [Streptomyces sp. NBC_00893]|uniref:hypothetical protein n=1 Tax=Streptomyces sp. NBC_00893 TaxID=2975862 RepID=UPI00225B378F|nr:hypothetical protein [Streptomyces sp. NBC_00893]MCX4845527.1 hypothetical protein [Streptomyces sp. NBC_00893]
MLGTSTGLIGLLTKDTSGTTGTPPSPGRAGVASCPAGALAITLLWRNPRDLTGAGHDHHTPRRTAP